MELLSSRLRERARELKLSNAEVARRAGLGERRYGNYVSGAREPDFATLLRICRVLDVTPNDLLLPDRVEPADEEAALLSRVVAAAKVLDRASLKVAIRQIEALSDGQQRRPAD
jgi:transcriptional regulator with XRE-family HTH domain